MQYATQWFLMVDFQCGVELRVGIKGKRPCLTFDPLQLLSDLIRKQGNFRVEQLHNKTLGRARDPRANGAWLNKLTE